MNKRHWLVHGIGALVFGSTAMFVRDSILPEFGRPYRTPTAEVARPGRDARPRTVVCSGRVESIRGEVEVSALIGGRLEEVRVTEGDSVRAGEILAVLEGARETEELRTAEANVTVARLKLEQVQAGNGKEEIDQAQQDVKALEAKLAYEKTNLECLRRLYQKRALTSDELQRKMHEVEQMMRQRESLQKRYEAIRRGPLPEQIEVARGELAVAETRLQRSKVEMGYRLIRAPISGTVLEVYRHAGDAVNTEYATPILRIADTSRLRIRLEIDEPDVARLRVGQEGAFQVRGMTEAEGRLVVKTIIPMFGPKRLFNPDTSARSDTRTIAVLCEPHDDRIPLFLGQRVTAYLGDARPKPQTIREARPR